MPQIADENAIHMVHAINASREAEELDPLSIEVHLNSSSRVQSEHMDDIGELTHSGPGGNTLLDRVEEAGFDLDGAWLLSENVGFLQGHGAADEETVTLMHQMFMDSDGHRANIMNPTTEHVGAHIHDGTMPGFAGADTPTLFFTVNFGSTDGSVLIQDPEDNSLTLFQGGVAVDTNAPADETETDETDENVEADVVVENADGEGEPNTDVEEDAQEDDSDEDEPAAEEEDEEDEAESSECFVATAAYGDRLHPEVVALRRYRDRVMTRSSIGRVMIRAYKVAGPVLARVVRPDGLSGQVFRRILGPISRYLDPR